MRAGFCEIALAGGRQPGRQARAWRGIVAVLLLAALLAGCAGGTPTPAPTLSATAQQLVGQWLISEGVLAKSGESLAGQKMEFRRDGTFTWEKKEGTYSVYEDMAVQLASTYGEELSYEIKLTGDTLEMNHYTSCGKQDHFLLQRLEP